MQRKENKQGCRDRINKEAEAERSTRTQKQEAGHPVRRRQQAAAPQEEEE